MSLKKISIHICSLIFLIVLTACEQAEPDFMSNWKRTDVRIFDDVNEQSPDNDLIALYTRDLSGEKQVRIDFIDLPEIPDYDLYLGLDTSPGGIQHLPFNYETDLMWDYLVHIPVAGEIKIFKSIISTEAFWLPKPGIPIKVIRNSHDDTFIISIQQKYLENFYPQAQIQVWIVQPGSNEVIDLTEPVSWDAKSPEEISILFAFTDTFPAYTPAQALRRWDGAHTGPTGSRHGLNNLLRTARSSEVPLLLLDLATPASLSALDYIGGVDLVQQLHKQKFVFMSNPIPASTSPFPSWIVEYWLDENLKIARQKGLPLLSILYQPGQMQLPHSLKMAIDGQNYYIQKLLAQNFNGNHFIVIPQIPSIHLITQATSHGPDILLRRLLAHMAYTQEFTRNDIVIIGGSLPLSTWGNPQAARATFQYFKQHPWIKIASAEEISSSSQLIFFSTGESKTYDLSLLKPEWLINSLQKSVDNPLNQAAWLAYRTSYAPVFPGNELLPLVRHSQLGVVDVLLKAADWLENPFEMVNCTFDLDHDNDNECLLASNKVFALLELDGGYLAFLFVKNNEAVHQIIGPSSQIISGISDPLTWQNYEGKVIDPSVLQGAFGNSDENFLFETGKQQIKLSSADGLIQKKFRINRNGIDIVIDIKGKGKNIEEMKIPILFDPWIGFLNGHLKNPNWLLHDDSIIGLIEENHVVEIKLNVFYDISSYDDASIYLATPENPNFQYPEGFFLPIPITVIKVYPENQPTIFISINLNDQ